MDAGYKKLIVWQKANNLASLVYQKTKSFPLEERYGITSQLRRASLSIPTNIVEGFGRQGRRELKNFINIALGSLAEVEYLIDFAFKLTLFSGKDHEELQSLRHLVGCLLWNFYKKL